MSESILTNNSAQSTYEQIDIIIQQQSRCYLGTSRYWNRHPYHTYGEQAVVAKLISYYLVMV